VEAPDLHQSGAFRREPIALGAWACAHQGAAAVANLEGPRVRLVDGAEKLAGRARDGRVRDVQQWDGSRRQWVRRAAPEAESSARELCKPGVVLSAARSCAERESTAARGVARTCLARSDAAQPERQAARWRKSPEARPQEFVPLAEAQLAGPAQLEQESLAAEVILAAR
jgi:hypothetical protein